MSTLIDILNKHEAGIHVGLKDTEQTYADWYASIKFSNNTIRVEIYDDEGNCFEMQHDEALPYEWIEQVHALVTDLKEAKAIPNYTVELPMP